MPLRIVLALSLVAVISGCASDREPEQETALSRRVLTKEMQEALTPHEVVERLREGNRRFVAEETLVRDHSVQVRKAVSGQFPKAIVLSCVDSRIPVEDVLDQGIGDIFVGRVAGNFEYIDQLGCMEFGSKLAGAKTA